MRLPRLVAAIMIAAAAAACTPTVMDEGPSLIQPTNDPTLVRFTHDGVGGITGETRYGPKTIEAALPGFTTESIQSANENSTEWALAAFNSDGFQVLQIFKGNDGRVRTVHGVTHLLEGPNGERIGMTFADIRQNRRKCRVGKNLWRGMAICSSRGHSNVELIFSIPGYQGPFDRLAPAEELNEAMLQRIVWTPDS